MVAKNYSLKTFTSPRIVQMLVSLLFISMGLIGFSTRGGLSGDFSTELSRLFGGGNDELIRNGVSAILLVSGLILFSALFVKGIPAKLISTAKIGILIIWLALILVLDVLVVNFSSFDASSWFVWVEQVVIHLIVLVNIALIRES